MKRLFLFIMALFFVVGCAQARDFNYGVKQLMVLNAKYNTTMDTYPSHIKQIDSMHDDLLALKRLQLDSGKEPFIYLVNYRILNLEAEKNFIQGASYGLMGTTQAGFGCKARPLVIESVSFRNSSALKGFGAVDLLREFVNKYPQEASSAGLSNINALFLNVTFYKISQYAESDSSTINYFCPINETLDLYKNEFRKETDLSKDYIDSLTYEQAVPIWKKNNDLI